MAKKKKIKVTKQRKPNVKGQKAQQAKEPEGKKKGAPKGSSSKSSKELESLRVKISKAPDAITRNKYVRKARRVIKKFKRASTRMAHMASLNTLKRTMEGLVREAGGAAERRKLQSEINAIVGVLNARSGDIVRIGDRRKTTRTGRRNNRRAAAMAKPKSKKRPKQK